MVRRSIALLFLVLALSSLLVACGDAVVPTYANATAVTVPDAFVKSYTSNVNSKLDNITIKAYATTDDLNTMKANLDNGFKNNGWSSTSDASLDAQLASAGFGSGAYQIVYQKDDSGALIQGFSSSDTTRAAGLDVPNGQTIFILITGKVKS